MTATAPTAPGRCSGRATADRLVAALVVILTVLAVGVIGAVDASASTTNAVGPQNAVGVIHIGAGRGVGAHAAVLPGQDRARAPNYDQTAVGSCVAAEDAGGAAEEAPDEAESCDANSFTAATPVLLANGKEEPISDVEVGDKVLATDPQTGKTQARPVTSIIVHSGEHAMVDVTLADGSSLTATDHHPVWDATTGQFTYAIDLHPGDQVEEANGQLLTITGLRDFDENVTAYNLTIYGIHTYYAGTTPVLVHNSCGDEIPWSSQSVRIANANLDAGSLTAEVASRSEAEEEMGPHLKGPDGTHYFYPGQ